MIRKTILLTFRLSVFTVSLWTAISLCALPFSSSAGLAQTQIGCPSLSERGQWPAGSTVYYDISIVPIHLRSQFREAFDRWTQANIRNGSNVKYQHQIRLNHLAKQRAFRINDLA
jgi:hypothetical protein